MRGPVFPKVIASGTRRTKALAVAGVGALLVMTAVTAHAAGWTLVTSPNKGTSSSLSAVSCSSSTLCLAVGVSATAPSVQKTLSEKWNGTKMAVVTSPPTGSNTEIELNGISCTSASFCIAVGRVFKSGGDQILTEKWNGSTWTELTSPAMGPDAFVDINGVSCKSTTFCMAVGWFTDEPSEAFAMKWNGTSWAVETVPNDGDTEDNILESVSCPTTTFCIAVGNGPGQLIDRWNGTTWSIVSTTANFGLDGVRCRSTTFCMAVGAQSAGANTDTLAEKWNGATWSVLTTPNVSGSPGNVLLSVSCTGTTFCMAGGFAQGSGTTQDTLTETWNGSTWSIVPSISPTSDSVINSVSCTTATGGNFCLAVGESTDKTLVEKYS
jgi:hypothetical protein